jgi:hypothetical protein
VAIAEYGLVGNLFHGMEFPAIDVKRRIVFSHHHLRVHRIRSDDRMDGFSQKLQERLIRPVKKAKASVSKNQSSDQSEFMTRCIQISLAAVSYSRQESVDDMRSRS